MNQVPVTRLCDGHYSPYAGTSTPCAHMPAACLAGLCYLNRGHDTPTVMPIPRDGTATAHTPCPTTGFLPCVFPSLSPDSPSLSSDHVHISHLSPTDLSPTPPASPFGSALTPSPRSCSRPFPPPPYTSPHILQFALELSDTVTLGPDYPAPYTHPLPRVDGP